MNIPTPQARPRVLIVATGGTIAGSSAAATGHRYTAGVLNITELTNAIGPIGNHVDLTAKQVFSIDSTEMTLADRITIAHTIHTELTHATHQGTPYNGVVVTHGTDTLEDTAFCLHHLLPAQTPIVITGAMLPADAPGADGPANLTDAITIAASPHAQGCGTLVAFAGRIHTGRDVTKRSASRIDAFTSNHGPIGET
ncbi:L-asparaginase, partial [Dermatophilus congolensis]